MISQKIPSLFYTLRYRPNATLGSPSLHPDRATNQLVIRSTVLSATEKEKPRPGLTPDWGFLVTLSLLPLEVRDGLSGARFPY